jgi:DNA polymerase III subunit beta
MKIVINQAAFLKTISNLQNIVEKRNTIPILANFKLEAKDGVVEITATDLDILAKDKVAATVETAGAITVAAQKLCDIVRKLPAGKDVVFEVDSTASQILISSGASKFRISYLSADDYPNISEGNFDTTFTIDAKKIERLLSLAKFAMSREETRYYLNGVYFHKSENTLRAVSTDGHRLARIDEELPAGAENLTGVIIPRKAVEEVTKLLAAATGDVEISVSENKVKFVFGNIFFLSKVVDGTFPDYARAIPSGNSKNISASKSALVEIVDRVATISEDKTKSVRFSFSKNNLTLVAKGREADDGKDFCEIDYKGDDFEIGFNSNYTLDIFRQIKGDSIQVALEDSNSPALIRDTADSGVLYVLMPMRF